MDLKDVLQSDFRYFPCLFALFVVGFVLLVVRDSCVWCTQVFVPATLVYSLGAALIGAIQHFLTVKANTEAVWLARVANEPNPKRFAPGIPRKQLRFIIAAHIALFVLLVLYLVLALPITYGWVTQTPPTPTTTP